MNRRAFHRNALTATLAVSHAAGMSQQPVGWSLRNFEDRVEMTRGGFPIATYVTKHPKIRRPFFQDLHTPGRLRITRPNPPDPAADDTDHDTMHPGLWLAFGELNGLDYWRNKAEVRHVGFLKLGTAENDLLFFETENHWLDADGSTVVCRELTRFTFRMIGPDAILDWSSKFTTVRNEFRFGHQEEMGLGVRLARPLTVKHGSGRIQCSAGGHNEKGTWGKTATWWAASVPALPNPTPETPARSGIQILARFDPGDRPYWGHTRDYGLIVANPSPRPDSGLKDIVIPSTTPLELHFRIRLFDHARPDFAAWASANPAVSP